jgi:hypothetical protein
VEEERRERREARKRRNQVQTDQQLESSPEQAA